MIKQKMEITPIVVTFLMVANDGHSQFKSKQGAVSQIRGRANLLRVLVVPNLTFRVWKLPFTTWIRSKPNLQRPNRNNWLLRQEHHPEKITNDQRISQTQNWPQGQEAPIVRRETKQKMYKCSFTWRAIQKGCMGSLIWKKRVNRFSAILLSYHFKYIRMSQKGYSIVSIMEHIIIRFLWDSRNQLLRT